MHGTYCSTAATTSSTSSAASLPGCCPQLATACTLLLLPLGWLLQLLQAAVLPAQLLVLGNELVAPEGPQEQVAVNAVPEPDGSSQLQQRTHTPLQTAQCSTSG
jgi:hypothetical protein